MSSEPVTQGSRGPSLQVLASKGFYQKGGDIRFLDQGLASKVVSTSVLFIAGSNKNHRAQGNVVYFDATVGTQPSGFQGAELISDRAFANWSKEDLAAVHGDIQSRKTSQKVQTLAMQTAQVSICASGTVALDDRVVRENVPLSAAESARVQSALGGDLDNLLGKTQQELDQAGIGYLGKRETRVVPNLRYVTHRRSGENMAKLRLKCVY